MKKVLAMLTALMLALMPAFSLAEQSSAMISAAEEMIRQSSPSAKYMLEGQQVTMDYSMEVTDLALDMIGAPEEIKSVVKDVLSTFGFRVSAQTAEGLAQMGGALIVSGQEAVDVTMAYGNKSLYLHSGVLGERIFQITWPQIKELIKQGLDSAVAEGSITQEQVDSLKNYYKELREDPAAALRKLVGEPNVEGLMNAVAAYPQIETGEVTEAPEALPGAMAVVTVPLQKEGLKRIMAEVAKLFWNMPVMQKLAENNDLTEETLIARFSELPDMLAEDTELKVYMGMENGGYKFYAVGDPKVQTGEQIRNVHAEALMSLSAAGDTQIQYTLDVEGDVLKGDMTMTVNEGTVQMNYQVTGETMENGVTYQPVVMIWTANVTTGAAPQAHFNMIMRVKESPDAAQMGFVMDLVSAEEDLGDHAEGHMDMTFSMEGIGDLVRIHETMQTGMAEAYIVSPDAVQPMAMSEEELNTLMQSIQTNLQMLPLTIIQYLPESLVQLLMQNSGT